MSWRARVRARVRVRFVTHEYLHFGSICFLSSFGVELPNMTQEGCPDFLVEHVRAALCTLQLLISTHSIPILTHPSSPLLSFRPQSRFAASQTHRWSVGDTALSWWPDPGDPAGGAWWTGTVVSLTPVDSSWRGSQWNTIRVAYANEEVTNQSPWELFRPGSADPSAPEPETERPPGLSRQLAQRLSSALDALCADPDNADLVEPPPPEVYAGRRYYCSVVALPLGLATLSARVSSGYYRTPQAVRHDAETLRQNSVAFNGMGSPTTEAAVAACDAITQLLPQEPQLPTFGLPGPPLPELIPQPRVPTTRSRVHAPPPQPPHSGERRTRAAAAAAAAVVPAPVPAPAAAERAAGAGTGAPRFSVRLRAPPG